MPHNFKNKPMSKLWQYWNDLPGNCVTPKPKIELLLVYAKKHCRLQFPRNPCAAPSTLPWQALVNFLNQHPHDHVDVEGDPLAPIPSILPLQGPEHWPSFQHLCWDVDTNNALHLNRISPCKVHILAPGLTPLTGIHHIHQILRGTILAFEWSATVSNFVDPFLWDSTNPMLYLAKLQHVKARIYTAGDQLPLCTNIDRIIITLTLTAYTALAGARA